MRFLEQIITEFESLELSNELFILGDFNNSKIALSLFKNIRDSKSSTLLQPLVTFLYPLKTSGGIEKQKQDVMGLSSFYD